MLGFGKTGPNEMTVFTRHSGGGIFYQKFDFTNAEATEVIQEDAVPVALPGVSMSDDAQVFQWPDGVVSIADVAVAGDNWVVHTWLWNGTTLEHQSGLVQNDAEASFQADFSALIPMGPHHVLLPVSHTRETGNAWPHDYYHLTLAAQPGGPPLATSGWASAHRLVNEGSTPRGLMRLETYDSTASYVSVSAGTKRMWNGSEWVYFGEPSFLCRIPHDNSAPSAAVLPVQAFSADSGYISPYAYSAQGGQLFLQTGVLSSPGDTITTVRVISGWNSAPPPQGPPNTPPDPVLGDETVWSPPPEWWEGTTLGGWTRSTHPLKADNQSLNVPESASSFYNPYMIVG